MKSEPHINGDQHRVQTGVAAHIRDQWSSEKSMGTRRPHPVAMTLCTFPLVDRHHPVSFLTFWFCMFRSYCTHMVGVRISFLKVKTWNMTHSFRFVDGCYSILVRLNITHLILFQCDLPLFLTPNEGSNTSENLLILLYSLNKVGWKEANPVLNFPLKGKGDMHPQFIVIIAFIAVTVTKWFFFFF